MDAETLEGRGPGVDPDLEPEVDDDEVEESVPVANSILDRLREQREELRKSRWMDFVIPGYEGLIAARLVPVPIKQMETLGRKLQKDRAPDSKMVVGSADTLIAACEQILVKDPDHPACLPDPDTGETTEWRPIDPDAPAPVRFDSRLAELLQFEAATARAVVYGVFNNDYALVRANIAYSEWLNNSDEDVDEEFLGE